MSYDTVEAGLLAVIRLLANYNATNSSQGDYRVMGKGNQRAVVLQPGPVTSRAVAAAPRRIRTQWIIFLELYIAFRTDISNVAARIRAERQALLDHIDKYPTLNGVSGVATAFIDSADEPGVVPTGERQWWRQVFRVRVEEYSTITIAE